MTWQVQEMTGSKYADLSVWRKPPGALTFGSGEVHVWRAALDLPASRLRTLQGILSAEEKERARRFYFRRDRERFVAARGSLRTILAGYLDLDPVQLRFCSNPHGKPALGPEFGGERLRFNLAHSDGLGLIAVTRGKELGVDLERIRRNLASEMIARRFFSPAEVASLLALPEDLQCEAFFTCWTRKEAYVKARGEGLSIPLDGFTVSLASGDSLAPCSISGAVEHISSWSLHHLCPGPGFVGALALEGRGLGISLWQWADA